jgi:GTP cyclohydrolase I
MNNLVHVARVSCVSGTHDEAVSQGDVERAFRLILSWIGENPDRERLRETPWRLVRVHQEYFSGYRQSPEEMVRKTVEETDGYDEMVVLRGVPFESHFGHHIAPLIGRAWVEHDGRPS